MTRALSLLLLLLVPAVALAGGTCSGVKGGCGRSSSRSSSGGSSNSSASGGTIQVSGYTRKDGTYVRPHTRHAPGTATHVEAEEYVAPPSPSPRTTARTGARTTARTTAWNGNVTDHDETPVAVVSRTAPPPSTKLPVRYVVYFTTGRMQQITNYEQDGDGFLVYGTSGGHIRYAKDRIDRFEALPTSENPKLRIWTSIDGKFSVEAEFVSEEGGKVKLRKTDGMVIEVESEKLSERDRDWIREHA
jgi:SLA1 homology domain 1, SHD1.